MIRIDEIYNNTFWPWLQANRPGTRMFFHDPFGRSDPDSLYNFGRDFEETNYIYFFDQEPIHLDLHDSTFAEVIRRNTDISWPHRTPGSIITSERDSEFVQQLCENNHWDHYYYFFHGWAALDWYRGYNRTFLMPEPNDRVIRKSFISPNRIIGGKRDHRMLLMYHLLRRGINNAHISFPRVCPVEQQDVVNISRRFVARYPDIQKVFSAAELPKHFSGETDHPMHSCWLSLFEQNAESLVHVITETVQQGRRHHITEKTFKPICLRMPFVLVSTMGSLEYLRSYGFKTFQDIWNEDYDEISDDFERLERVSNLLKYLDDCSVRELQQIHRHAQASVQHNYQHFYSGSFENILWSELTDMLRGIKQF